MKYFSKIIVIFYSLFLLSPVFSQPAESENSDKADNKETKVFVSKEVIVKDRKEVPGTVTEILPEDLKTSTKTDLVNIVKEKVPSFNTSNNRLMGFGVAGSGAGTLNIRGVGLSGWGPSTGITVLINGLDTTMAIMGHPVADILTMKNIERIEVLHGPQPVLFGDSATGGVINVVTKKQDVDGYSTNLSASYGSYNTTDDYVQHRGRIGNFHYGVSYNFQYTDGHRDQKINGTTFKSQFRSHNGSAYFGYKINKNLDLTLNGYIADFNIHDPGAENSTDDELEVFDITRGGTSIVLHNNYNRLKGSLMLFGNWGHHKSYLPAYDDKSTWESYDDSLGAKLSETVEIIKYTKLTVGSEIRRYGGKADYPDYGDPALSSISEVSDVETYIDDKHLTDISVFGLLSQGIFDNFIILSAGSRYTHNSEYQGYTSWQAGVSVNPLDTTQIYANITKGFKLPDVRQYFQKFSTGDKTISETDTDLDPETYTSIEGGIEHEILRKLAFHFSVYHITAKNKFIKVQTNPSPPPYSMEWRNADRFVYTGVETSLRYTVIEWINITAGYSYIDNEYHNEVLTFVPEHKLLTGVSVEKYNVRIALNSEYAKDVYSETDKSNKLDDYFVLNAKLLYTFLKRYQAFINFNNITDLDYKTYPDYPMPGFNVLGGINVTI